MTEIQGRVTMKRCLTLKDNGMNNGYGYFLTGTQSSLDGMFLGLDRPDVHKSMAELNANRKNLNLPEVLYFFVIG